MIVGVGVDILHLPRLQSLVSRRGRDALAKRILHPSEFAQFLVAEDKNRFLAVRWTVKEAAFKAAQPNYYPTWKQLSFVKEEKKPLLRWHPVHPPPEGIPNLHASVSHDGEYISAFVVAERSTK